MGNPTKEKIRCAKKYEGRVFESNKYGKYKVIKYNGAFDIRIAFVNTGFERSISTSSLKKGKVYDPTMPITCGVGFMGCGRFTQKSDEYNVWYNMLRRCYDEKLQLNKTPTYAGCLVCDEWHNFQNFAEWYNSNYPKGVDCKYHLDKDLLGDGKLYSPDTCCFLHKCINIALITKTKSVGYNPRGVCRDGNKYQAKITIDGNVKFIGSFNTKVEAGNAYNDEKLKYILRLAEKYKGSISKRAYYALLDYKIKKL